MRAPKIRFDKSKLQMYFDITVFLCKNCKFTWYFLELDNWKLYVL